MYEPESDDLVRGSYPKNLWLISVQRGGLIVGRVMMMILRFDYKNPFPSSLLPPKAFIIIIISYIDDAMTRAIPKVLLGRGHFFHILPNHFLSTTKSAVNVSSDYDLKVYLKMVLFVNDSLTTF